MKKDKNDPKDPKKDGEKYLFNVPSEQSNIWQNTYPGMLISQRKFLTYIFYLN